ncbi:hypothetical protein EHI8A_065680 [Entamoeba histolytica HM-1:IMSS-B]|uniref:Uncharacterized protein n=6 Tax=Entamoeba histolytica TaxID=5759 RepID=C4M7L7_ENTH1|nr:hypothetical protein EHI_200040 [Entamoeba histolytica HM-1:IMSS]EMD45968.1 Hypothetical protein EHI5A_035100 [Entamoeba histolytica KU27]EMH72435.1 hypothetical protein EHI8A_065680 [Entamoeba histolytica HM-1:IMSS-B]EMS17357.1 hypothetical protein KM1_122090 [Entamoeba histolytica HM-3:IMSS]ENY60386.1 hypothetical protein EHI7A_062350 [Entamoeba histolytica HM-1:IMSS-A]GAT97535.1 hypothetical protein CL6EHI_200040 [Entamoeba histolytica]|eukprot:XP_649724.1 hypothetical protein EHI_200040 [Entamoeba histolytica HM-1:IMSS]
MELTKEKVFMFSEEREKFKKFIKEVSKQDKEGKYCFEVTEFKFIKQKAKNERVIEGLDTENGILHTLLYRMKNGLRMNKHFGLLRNINRVQNEVIEIHNKLIEWIEMSYTKEDLIKVINMVIGEILTINNEREKIKKVVKIIEMSMDRGHDIINKIVFETIVVRLDTILQTRLSDLNGIYRGFQNLIWKYSDEEIKELKELPKFIGEETEETKKTAKVILENVVVEQRKTNKIQSQIITKKREENKPKKSEKDIKKKKQLSKLLSKM